MLAMVRLRGKDQNKNKASGVWASQYGVLWVAISTGPPVLTAYHNNRTKLVSTASFTNSKARWVDRREGWAECGLVNLRNSLLKLPGSQRVVEHVCHRSHVSQEQAQQFSASVAVLLDQVQRINMKFNFCERKAKIIACSCLSERALSILCRFVSLSATYIGVVSVPCNPRVQPHLQR
jgi:hypothetical protein